MFGQHAPKRAWKPTNDAELSRSTAFGCLVKIRLFIVCESLCTDQKKTKCQTSCHCQMTARLFNLQLNGLELATPRQERQLFNAKLRQTKLLKTTEGTEHSVVQTSMTILRKQNVPSGHHLTLSPNLRQFVGDQCAWSFLVKHDMHDFGRFRSFHV